MPEWLAEFVPQVYRFALRITGNRHGAEDLTQETFLRAWQRRQQLRDRRAARVWLFRIAANLQSDEFRRSDSHPGKIATLTEPLMDQVAASSHTPQQGIEIEEDLRQALEWLDALPPRQRAVLYLTAVEELSLSEVGEVLQIEKNTAKVNLSLARKRMRQKVSQQT